MPRKKLPTAMKMLKGTAQPCRMNPNEPVTTVVLLTCPSYLDRQGKKSFAEFADMLARMQVTAHSDQKALGILADRYAKYLEMRKLIRKEGSTYTTMNTQGTEIHRTRPEVAIMNDALKDVLKLMSEFGLTPSSRAKVSAINVNHEDPFNKFLKSGNA